MLEVKEVKLSNLADASKLCVGANLPPGLDPFAAVDMQRAKLNFLRQYRGLGAGARVAYRDGKLVGSLEWYPVEVSPTPVEGKDLFVIHCARASEPGNRAEIVGAMVAAAEEAWKARAGVAAIGRKRAWSDFGFEYVDTRRAAEKDGGSETLFLRRFKPEAEARFLSPKAIPQPDAGKLRVDLFLSDRCPWNGWVYGVVKKACASYGKPVQIVEHDVHTRPGVEREGIGAGVAINGVLRPLLRPHLLPDERAVHRILDLG